MSTSEGSTTVHETPMQHFGAFIRSHAGYYDKPPNKYAVNQGIWHFGKAIQLFGTTVEIGDIRFSETALFNDDDKNTGKSAFRIEYYEGEYKPDTTPYTTITADSLEGTFYRDDGADEIRENWVINKALMRKMGYVISADVEFADEQEAPDEVDSEADYIEPPQSQPIDAEIVASMLGDLNQYIGSGQMVQLVSGNNVLI